AVTKTGFKNAIYLTTEEGKYAAYSEGAQLGTNHPDGNWAGEIAMGQSFWVQSTGGSSLSFTESCKAGTYEFVRKAQPRNFFKVRLAGQDRSDELAICFRDGATWDKDIEFDAEKRRNEGLFNF